MTPPRSLSRRSFVRTALGAVVGPTVWGCAPSPILPTDGARLNVRPGTPSRVPTRGEATPLGLGTFRDGYLYVPSSYAPEKPMPLFVALHGAGGEALNWTSYFDRAEARGMIFLAPESRSVTWDLIRGEFGQDVQFLGSALRYTFDRCRVDPSRVALGGFSDGASYALSLGVANGDLFTHLVGYSPGFYAPGAPITGKPRIFISHGDQDRILSFRYTSSQLVPRLRGDGYDVSFVSFTGDHAVPAAVSEAALDWFLGDVDPS